MKVAPEKEVADYQKALSKIQEIVEYSERTISQMEKAEMALSRIKDGEVRFLKQYLIST